MAVTTSAPGKLFLFGEYGVLAGGWSVVAAVDRRVVARRRQKQTGYEALGADLDDATALPQAVLAELGELDRSAGSLEDLSTDIRQLFVESGEKLGLGSSAASTVALTAACLLGTDDRLETEEPIGADHRLNTNTRLNTNKRRQIFERAFAAHRRLQGGRGSCADVAASTFGGIVGYRLRQPCEPFAGCTGPDLLQTLLQESVLALEPAEVASCQRLPVRVEPVWLGKPAVSTSFVSRCEDALQRDPDAVQATLCRSSDIAASAIDALQRSDASQLLELVTQADQTLEELGELIRAPIVTDAHRELRRHARDSGLVVKPSGAGGGDFSLVFGADTDTAWEPFLAKLPAGVRHMPMALGTSGVRQEAHR